MASTSSPAHQEIDAAISYLLSHLKSVIKPSSNSSTNLRHSLSTLLEQRYASHWHIADPEKGSAYRALTRSKANLDSLIVKALKDASIKLALKEVADAMTASMGADKWTLWIDPGCVSIRMHGSGGTHYSSSSAIDSAFSPSSNKVNMSGIIEIWGKLPASVSGVQAVIPHPVPTPSSASKQRPKTPLTNKRSTINLRQNEAASLAAEFEALAFNASPVKKSKAIAIIRPDSASSPASTPAPSQSMLSATAVPQLLHKGLAGFNTSAAVAVATPPRAFPPLSFTIQESTSPYVPSFASQVAAAAAASASVSDAGADSSSSAASSGSETARTATPLDSLALNSVDPSVTGNVAASDPFARPSSRSSTTSIASATSCSIFSHASSESRSSSIGSYSPLSSSSPEELAAMAAVKVASANNKASAGEMDAAMNFTFPPPSTHGSLSLAPASLPMSLNGSAPNSPSKPRRPRHHSRAMSTSSNISATSSSAATSSSNTAERPNHMRKTSSRTEVRVDTSDNIVQDYSNGKVGVLGGGVKLGLMGGSSSSGNNNKRENKHRRTASSASNVSSSTFNSMSSAATAVGTGEFKRPRNPSRTHSNDADLFRLQQQQAQQAYYTNNFHQQHHHHSQQQHVQHNQHQRIPSGSYWNMDPYAAASSVVYQH